METERLVLRPVTQDDFYSLCEMGQDPRVMELLGGVQTQDEVQTFLNKIRDHQKAHGFSYTVIEEKNTKQFLGLVGLLIPSYSLPFSPCVEIGWRLNFHVWGQGFAFEAASELMKWGFNIIGLKEIVSFTAIINQRSEALMKRLEMTSDPKENFFHPKLEKNHPLCKHVLYRKKKII